MISKGSSCDTEDWSNAITEKYIRKGIKIDLLNSNKISQYYCIFDQINKW